VSRTADKSEIKKAFYSKAKQFHPDTNKSPDAQQKFAEINNAYEILSDPEKRKRYDVMGHDAEQMGGMGGGPGGMGGMHGFNAEDVFRDFFGMGGGGAGMGGGNPFAGMGGMGMGDTGPTRGADVETQLNISFMEAVQGTTRTLNVVTDVPCTVCSGTGNQPKSTATTCTDCGGKGSMRVNQGFFAVQMVCRGCGGKGKKHPNCHACSGEGVVKQRRNVDVTVPAGADSDTVLRLTGQGDAGKMVSNRSRSSATEDMLAFAWREGALLCMLAEREF
jgi:molecular chaperone DnaJ